MKTKSLLIASAAAAVLLFTNTNAWADTVLKLKLPFQLLSEQSELGSAQDCPDIAWPVQLTGEMRLFVHDDVRDGLHHLLFHEVVQGGAVDANGSQFVFSYVNTLHSTFTLSTSDPTAVNFDTDHFSMEGPAGHVNVSFGGLLSFDASGEIIGIQINHAQGNIACDPI
jgi:hypothetical protein